MKVQMKRKGVKEEKKDKKGEKKVGEGDATLSLERPWFYNTRGSGSQKGGGRGSDQLAMNHEIFFLADRLIE